MEWDSLSGIEMDPENEWWQSARRDTAISAEKGVGRFFVGVTDLGGKLDVAQSLRGKKRLMVDLFRRPKERKRLARWGRRALRYWINKQYKDAEVRGFAEKIKRAYPYLFTAVTHPGVELHNNRSEFGLRELVVQRKIIGTLRNEKGTRIYETLATLLATWKQRGLDPGQALSNALSQSWKPKPTKRSS